jgi:hypothetical protein
MRTGGAPQVHPGSAGAAAQCWLAELGHMGELAGSTGGGLCGAVYPLEGGWSGLQAALQYVLCVCVGVGVGVCGGGGG